MIRKAITFLFSYPMKCVEPCRFVDILSGGCVGVYEDRFGRQWLARGRFSLFRVEKPTYFEDGTNGGEK